jgi:hypothetical protein
MIMQIGGLNVGQQPAGTFCIQHEWPQLARALYDLEQKATAGEKDLDEQQKAEERERIRAFILEQCSAYERPYAAYEYVRRGRAAEIVGNPHYTGKDAQEYELPFTGLEGYYAGSEETPERPGMTKAQIIEEEANIGLELMKKVKKHCIENYCWVSFVKMQRASEDGTADVADLRNLYLLWTGVVRRLNERIYENEECRGTPLEQLEAIMRRYPKLAKDKYLLAEYMRLLSEEAGLSQQEREEEKAKRVAKQKIFRSRLEEFTKFREATYAHLKDHCQRYPHIHYQIEDKTFADADILETLYLPKPAERSSFPSYLVNLTPEQLEAYLFLAHLGEKGGNPLTRSILLSKEDLTASLLW